LADRFWTGLRISARWPTWVSVPPISHLWAVSRQAISFSTAISQAMQVGVRALPILSLITFFIGLILALQSAL